MSIVDLNECRDNDNLCCVAWRHMDNSGEKDLVSINCYCVSHSFLWYVNDEPFSTIVGLVSYWNSNFSMEILGIRALLANCSFRSHVWL